MNASWIDRVRNWMIDSGTSQESLAREMDCTRGAIGHYLAGRRQPTLTQLERIASIMKVYPSWLLYGSGPARVSEPAAEYRTVQRPLFGLPVIGSHSKRLSLQPTAYLSLDKLSERCYCIVVDPKNRSPRAHEGETLILDPDSASHPGDEVLVGFQGGDTALQELIAKNAHQIVLGTLYDRRLQRTYNTREIAFMHRVIAVLRRDALPKKGIEKV